jgi:putative Mn2+ efflux pump MntP
MNDLELIGIAFGLGMDACAVAAATGVSLRKVTGHHVFRLAWHFGLFQFLMPILGWLAGRSAAAFVQTWDHWIAFGLLLLIGGKMLYEAGFRGEEELFHKDPTRGWSLVGLSVATSIDALAVGASLAFLNVTIWIPAIIIGLVAGLLTLLGIRFGQKLGAKFGRKLEFAGGLVLWGIGVKILLEH